MMKLAAVLVGVVVGISPCRALPDDPAEYAAWEAGMFEKIAEQKNLPAEDAIPKLALWVYQLSRPDQKEKEVRPVLDAARSALLAIPGHAEFYAKKLEEARRKVDEAEGIKKGIERSNLLAEQMYSFNKLGLMPSPETVRVLGEYLFDERGANPDAKPGGKYGLEDIGESPNSALAVRAIARLPIVSRPIQTPWDKAKYWEDLEPWKLWYQQVKAGTRTFRFEGDPQEYSLAGPVSETRDPRIEDRASRSNDVRSPSLETENKSANLPIWPLSIAGILLVLASWFAMKQKPAAT